MNCPICFGSSVNDAFEVPFNKSCEDRNGLVVPVTRGPVTYQKCRSCGHIWCQEMLEWPDEKFSAEVYNDYYLTVDPEYSGSRARRNAEYLHDFFIGKPPESHLDYGCGNGELVRLLRQKGWYSEGYDKHEGGGTVTLNEGIEYSLITSFEVIEHCKDINVFCDEVTLPLTNNGMIIFSTKLYDLEKADPKNWWYCAPRNGHIQLFTEKSLTILFDDMGFRIDHITISRHLARRK